MKNYQKIMWKIDRKKSSFSGFYFFNKLYNLIYLTNVLKSQRKCSTSFKDLQVSFLKHLKSNFFFCGGLGLHFFGGGGGQGFGGGGGGKGAWLKSGEILLDL